MSMKINAYFKINLYFIINFFVQLCLLFYDACVSFVSINNRGGIKHTSKSILKIVKITEQYF